MGYIKINQEKVTKGIAEQLKDLCPFDAFDYFNGYLSINAGCKVCKICIKKGPHGVCEFIESVRPTLDRTLYRGIAVFIQQRQGLAHPVSWELIGKAKELAQKTHEPVYGILIGEHVEHIAKDTLRYGVDKVFLYDDAAFKDFNVEIYTNVIAAFNEKYRPNIMLVGGTALGRSFAPRVAARLKTGLTADCTSLDIKANGDLLQIRPAFGGNIMAKIHTPSHRPQLATIRYKMFSAPEIQTMTGQIIKEETKSISKETNITLLKTEDKPKHKDISEAEIIVAVGRAFKKKKDLELIEPLVKKLGAEVACTRPLIENGWFDPRRQIGLSGRTVKPKLIINLGISGAVQYIEGMKESELIISINNDPDNRLFDLSHYAIQGDIYEVLTELNQRLAKDD